jgi:hypothetical protein
MLLFDHFAPDFDGFSPQCNAAKSLPPQLVRMHMFNDDIIVTLRLG